VLDVKATVARRLEEAGAVLVAKLTLGAIAQGRQLVRRADAQPVERPAGLKRFVGGLGQFRRGRPGRLRPRQRDAGQHRVAVAACRASGLRPTFGRVSRHGCMTLAWTMDKVGPIARSVEDCALVFGAIHGFDGQDAAAVDRPFAWPSKRDLRTLRVGYVETGVAAKDRNDLRVPGATWVCALVANQAAGQTTTRPPAAHPGRRGGDGVRRPDAPGRRRGPVLVAVDVAAGRVRHGGRVTCGPTASAAWSCRRWKR